MTFLAMLQQGASIQVCHANSDDWSGGVRHAHAFTSISANFTHRKEVPNSHTVCMCESHIVPAKRIEL